MVDTYATCALITICTKFINKYNYVQHREYQLLE